MDDIIFLNNLLTVVENTLFRNFLIIEWETSYNLSKAKITLIQK